MSSKEGTIIIFLRDPEDKQDTKSVEYELPGEPTPGRSIGDMTKDHAARTYPELIYVGWRRY